MFFENKNNKSMQNIPKSFQLSDGNIIPSIGLGTANHQDKDSMENAIMNCNYSHIDTASRYGNEE